MVHILAKLSFYEKCSVDGCRMNSDSEGAHSMGLVVGRGVKQVGLACNRTGTGPSKPKIGADRS